jgi:hypothetical protein
MAKGPKKIAAGAKSLSEALDFVSIALNEEGMFSETHVTLRDQRMIARCGEISASYPIEEDLRFAVHGGNLGRALGKLSGAVTLAHSDKGLVLRAGRLSVTLATLDTDQMQPVAANPAIAPLNAHFVAAVADLAPLIKESGNRIINYSLLMNNDTLVSSFLDGRGIIEIWHGNYMPTGVGVPFRFCKAVAACRLEPVAFGFDGGSFTIHYDNGAWIKTQLLTSPWPDAVGILNALNPNTLKPVTKDFFDAVSSVHSITKANEVEVQNLFVTAEGHTEKATHEIAPVGIEPGQLIPIGAPSLLLVRDHITHIEFDTNPNSHMFMGANRRGCIAKIKV